MTKPRYPVRPKKPKVSIEVEPLVLAAKREYEAMLRAEQEAAKKKVGRPRKGINVGPKYDDLDFD